MYKSLLWVLLALVSLSTLQAKETPLTAEQAFTFSTQVNQKNELIIKWVIAPGYYLYRNQIKIMPAPGNQIKLGPIVLPMGQKQQDELHGVYQAYRQSLEVVVPLLSPLSGNLSLKVSYQGCADLGVCYSPIKKTLQLNAEEFNHLAAQAMPSPEETDFVDRIFSGKHHIITIILSFLGLGLLLAFTPCVLPMVPILSGMIIGQHKTRGHKAIFFLSLIYVLGMALTYAVIGMVIASIGSNIQAQLQKPWIIVLFSGLFVLLSLSLFGFYELQMPRRWQQYLTAMSNRQQGGHYVGVFIMGALSTLIVSPCVSAPLVGVLAYIGQTGDVLLGGVSFLALGFGMGLPLLLIGLSAKKFLPKAGNWMKTIERLFGLLMLGMAVWMLSRMIPGPVTLALWGMLLIGAAVFLDVFTFVNNGHAWWVKILGFLALFYGLILIIGAVLGNSDPWHPWEKMGAISNESSLFVPVKSMEDLDQQLKFAKMTNKPVMLDFSAAWCVACHVMDRTVFSHSLVRQALTPFILLRADVTNNNDFDQALLKRFKVIGPPTMIFFDRNGQEIQRIVGEVDEKIFLKKLKIIKQ